MSYQSTVLVDNPLFFNRGGTVDLGSLGLTGTVNGGVSTGQAGILPNGDAQTSDLFDSTGYISASDVGLPSGSNSWSQELWCKPLVVTGSPTLFSFGTTGGSGWQGIFIFSGPNDIGAGNWFTGGEQPGTLAVAGTTYYVCVTYDNSSGIRLYVGDVGANTLTLFGPKVINDNITLSGTMYIGRDGAGDYYHGYTQERAIYGSRLSDTRVTAHWQAGLTKSVPGAMQGNHRSFVRIQ